MKGTEHFIMGDTACAEAAIISGCKFFAGYPITPATEVAERMARRLPQVGGVYIQMEDELASMAAILGASWGGLKSMTATSGPGFSLMMENIGLGIVMEVPCVVVNVQRAGPSTGLPTLCAQGDMMQARWGSHGHYEIIALSASSPQELFDATIKAFNLSEKYRLPVLIMTDEVVGHMTEKVVIPPSDQVEIYPRRMTKLPPEEYLPYLPDEDMVAPMVEIGEGYKIHTTGLTHDKKGYPVINASVQKEMMDRLIYKIRNNIDDIVEYEEIEISDAEVVIVTYGISVRPAQKALEMAREKGIKCGMLKLTTIWPFAEKKIMDLASQVKGFVVPEINYGQISLEVERCSAGKAKTILVGHAGGAIFNPNEILEAVEKL
ncbi:MAG: 2-oxoacid:acceptor oxidoreductase subunit alpha [Pseudomonadota bacterium]